MKLTTILFWWALLFCLPIQVFGQKSTVSNAQIIKNYAFFKNSDPNLSHENYFGSMAGSMRLSPQSSMVLLEIVASKNGVVHYKYQQYHENLPVFGNRYILHEKDGVVKTATGQFHPDIMLSSRPGIDAETAVAYAKRHLKARKYHTNQAEPILCFIDPAFPKSSETLRLAYQIDLHSTEPFSKQRYFIDAANGKVLTQFPLVLEEGVPSTAKTRYYGIQNIITDSLAPQSFVLKDPSRGGGIYIFNYDESVFTNTSSTWDLTNAQKMR
jgi:Zn-dependent metalloprotease